MIREDKLTGILGEYQIHLLYQDRISVENLNFIKEWVDLMIVRENRRKEKEENKSSSPPELNEDVKNIQEKIKKIIDRG